MEAFFCRTAITFVHQLLPPAPKLFVNVDFDGAHVGAGTAKRRSKWQVGKLLHVNVRRKNGPDRTRNGRVVAVPAAAAVNRTSIKAESIKR